jgi:hypothetical protein
MTSDQYQLLLKDLAHVAGLSDPSGLLKYGLLKLGETSVVLVHEPEYDENLLQIRVLLGGLPPKNAAILTKAMLQSNYVNGYGGEHVFSLLPDTDDVVFSMRHVLHPALSAQELWLGLCEVARMGDQMWKAIDAVQKASPHLEQQKASV